MSSLHASSARLTSSTAVREQRARFDTLIEAPERARPLRGLFLRRISGVIVLALTVAQIRLVHLASRIRRRDRPDAGMTTAEYAVGTVAACGFAALLYKVVTSGAVSSALNALVTRALHAV